MRNTKGSRGGSKGVESKVKRKEWVLETDRGHKSEMQTKTCSGFIVTGTGLGSGAPVFLWFVSFTFSSQVVLKTVPTPPTPMPTPVTPGQENVD